jgi:hypothetical protein
METVEREREREREKLVCSVGERIKEKRKQFSKFSQESTNQP